MEDMVKERYNIKDTREGNTIEVNTIEENTMEGKYNKRKEQ
jgi:hypothetical protein